MGGIGNDGYYNMFTENISTSRMNTLANNNDIANLKNSATFDSTGLDYLKSFDQNSKADPIKITQPTSETMLT